MCPMVTITNTTTYTYTHTHTHTHKYTGGGNISMGSSVVSTRGIGKESYQPQTLGYPTHSTFIGNTLNESFLSVARKPTPKTNNTHTHTHTHTDTKRTNSTGVAVVTPSNARGSGVRGKFDSLIKPTDTISSDIKCNSVVSDVKCSLVSNTCVTNSVVPSADATPVQDKQIRNYNNINNINNKLLSSYSHNSETEKNTHTPTSIHTHTHTNKSRILSTPPPVIKANTSVIPILTKQDYTTRPSSVAVSQMSEAELARVQDFQVTRNKVGSVVWEGITDIRGLDLDSLVSIEPGSVCVYEKQESLPPLGCGLNKTAVVSIIVRPNKLPTDPEALKHLQAKREDKLRSLCASQGTHFLDFDPHTWCWRFRVDGWAR
eukprot:GHVR01174915.1.p1 GENE.GHVR01174915.1~~GHVR01174915.1.p1  ORF type:complete len:374 (+),score=146.75 GHVR01174915.1:453-1574(+)